MLIDLVSLIDKYRLRINGILHVGASVCEELNIYKKCNLTNDNIYWIEGNEDNIQVVKNTLESDIKIYNYLIDEIDNVEVDFNISNALMSSSLLDFGSHLQHHQGIFMVEKRKKKTTRLDTFIEENKIPINKLNFLNIDIQGTELRAIKSLGKYIDNIDYIMTEINIEYVYKNCTLLKELDNFLCEKGFSRVENKIYGNCGWGDAFYIKNKLYDENKDYYTSNIFNNYKRIVKDEVLYFYL
jgi:FkbM family methyltransferase